VDIISPDFLYSTAGSHSHISQQGISGTASAGSLGGCDSRLFVFLLPFGFFYFKK
jgi:hypothetical protein